MPNLASQIRTAFASMVWNTRSSSPGELEMTPSTSEVASSRASELGQSNNAGVALDISPIRGDVGKVQNSAYAGGMRRPGSGQK
jgi:hypothetical protein